MGTLRPLLPRKMPQDLSQDSPKPQAEAALFHTRMVRWDKLSGVSSPSTSLPPNITLFGTLRGVLCPDSFLILYLELEAAPRSPDPRVAFQQHQIFRHARRHRACAGWRGGSIWIDWRVVTFCSRISYLGGNPPSLALQILPRQLVHLSPPSALTVGGTRCEK